MVDCILRDMNPEAKAVLRTYLTLTLLSTLAASFIWGINTLFLLDAGLSNTEAFAANAFYTIGQVLFEVPTGVVADVRGRRTSYVLGAITLLITTLGYLYLWQIEAAFWAWALVSALLGLGFTFFSGATEAWLVDALNFTKFKGSLDSVFARGQAASGAAMLVGSVSGGFVAQATNLGVPYIFRGGLLLLTLVAALLLMRDIGFTPERGLTPAKQARKILRASVQEGLRNPPVRWVMLAAPFSVGVSFYVFYAMQPYLLELYGDPTAYGIAGLAAAIVGGAQIAGALLVGHASRFFRYRTQLILFTAGFGTILVIAIGLINSFWWALLLLVFWAVLFSIGLPVRQSYINGLIDSKQRATVLSFDSLMNSSGGVIAQPALGKVADVNGYAASYIVSGLVQMGAIPFLLAARRQNAKSDPIT